MTLLDAAPAIRAYLWLLHGGTEGWVFAACGTPRLGESGKVEHPDFEDQPFAIPRQLDDLVEYLLAASESKDTWVTPGLSHNPTRLLAKRKSLPSSFLWADLDGAGAQDQARAVEIASNGGFCVLSGRGPGHLHVYVRLAVPAESKQLQELNRRLVKFLHADASPSALNGYLRPVGTINHKAALLRAGPGTEVRLDGHGDGDGDGDGWEIAELEARLPPGRSTFSVMVGEEPVSAGPLPEPLPVGVAVILADPADAAVDRSARLFALVVACRAGGLSPGQTVGAARYHRPSTAKYGNRLDTEVARILAKLPPYRRQGER